MIEKAKAYVNSMSTRVQRWVKTGHERGSEIVQTVIVLGFAVGLGVALIAMQGSMEKAIDTAGSSIVSIFKDATDYKPPVG